MARSILVGEVATGRRITQIPVSDASWSMVHRDGGDISVDIPLGAREFKRLERQFVGGLYPGGGEYPSGSTFPESASPVWRIGDGLRPEFLAALDPGRCFLAVLEGDEVLEAGPIWTWDYDDSKSILTVRAAGMWSLFDHRYVMGVLSSGFAAWTVTYEGLSLGTIAKRLVELAESHVGGGLPIVLPEDETVDGDDEHERTYNGYDLATVRNRLDQLMGVSGGPDIAFQPRLTADRLGVEWVMRVGTEADPLLHQAGDDWIWDMRVPRGGVAGLSVRRDASRLASRAWASGQGMETALLMSRAEDSTLLDAGYPLYEVADSRSTVGRQATLDRWASSSLRSSSRPWMTWTLDVRADMSPRLGLYRPGDWAKVWVPQTHPLLGNLVAAGWYRARVIGVSGDMSDTVRLTMAPQMEVR